MAKIVLCYRKDLDKRGNIMHSYAESIDREIKKLGHEVLPVGLGHDLKTIKEIPNIKLYDLLLDIDCGRAAQDGKLHFQLTEGRAEIPSAVRWIDTHGNPSLHRRLSKHYDHVFFAVYRCRDLFSNHPSSHWLPNISDPVWFDYTNYLQYWNKPRFDFGFFGSKGGLDRAEDLITLCNSYDLLCDVREIGSHNRNRWPTTGEAMAACRVLFNRGQKHDGPNQRVMESMLMNRPLITDRDKIDGMKQLFEEGTHYLGYETYSELSIQMQWCLDNPDMAKHMAQRAYDLVKAKYTVEHRVKEMLEVCL